MGNDEDYSATSLGQDQKKKHSKQNKAKQKREICMKAALPIG